MINILGTDVSIQGRFCRTARLAAERFDFLADPQAALLEIQRLKERVDLFTFLQGLPEAPPRFDYPLEWDNLAVLELSTYEAWWTKQVDNKTRNMVRRAEKKGVEIRESEFDGNLVRGIWQIYNETPVRQGKPFPHFGKDIETVRREAATYLERSRFICAYLGEELIGFIKLTDDAARIQSSIMNIVSVVKERDRAPTNALVAQCVKVCADRGIGYLIYAKFAYGKKERDSLADFKHNNGFRRVDIPRYYVPLTHRGRAALKMGLHRSLTDRIPESVLEKLRQVRGAWYSRKAGTPAGKP